MSGPKVDTAEIRRQEREKIEAARRERILATKHINEKIRLIMECASSEGLERLSSDVSLASYKSIQTQSKKCLAELNRILKTVKFGNEMNDVGSAVKSADKCVQSFYSCAQNDIELVDSLLGKRKETVEYESKRLAIVSIQKGKVTRAKSVSKKTETDDPDVQPDAQALDGALCEFLESSQLCAKHKGMVLKLRQKLLGLEQDELSPQRKNGKIKACAEEFKEIVDYINTELEDMQDVYEQYTAEFFDSDEAPLALSAFNSAKDIIAETENVRRKANNGLSGEYIRRQINEVMKKHGYDIVRSDTIMPAEQSGQILYGINDDAAIDVFVSDSNQVTMRIVGIGFDTQISNEENEKLFQEQCAFCGMHPQITKELELRGVLLHTKKHLPPNRQFNKKIQISSHSDKSTASRAKKELRRGEAKIMRKEIK